MIVCDCDELVKALREHAGWMGPNNYVLPIAMYDDLLKAADAIETLSKPNWISVEERLPDMHDSNWVIGIANGKVGNMEYRDAVVMVAYDPDEGVWYLDSDLDVKVKVTHWMPLPALPKEEVHGS